MANEEPKAIVPAKKANVLVPGYFDGRTVTMLSARLRNLPAYNKTDITDTDMYNLSMAALQLQLNPFTNEICLIPDKAQGGAIVFVQMAGRLRKSREQLAREGGSNASMNFEDRQLTQEEMEQLLIPSGSVAVEVMLYDSVTRNNYLASLKEIMPIVTEMLKAAPGDSARGAAFYALDVIEKLIGKAPVTRGIGYLTASEADSVNKTQSGKMKERSHYPVYEKALKRAMTSALKKRFNIDIPAFEIDNSEIGDYLAKTVDAYFDQGQWSVTKQPANADDDASKSIIDAMEHGTTIKCSTCGHDDVLHGADLKCEVKDCDCLRFEPPVTKPEENLSPAQKLEKGKKALGRDGGGID